MNTICAGGDRAVTTQQDERWQRVLLRDASADGLFVYAVSSTGVYCRPSCPSRTARPEHVSFYADPVAAEAAGFRACRRCHPRGPSLQQRHTALIERLCRYIEASAHVPDLMELAQQADLSPFYLQRLFKAGTGLSPAAYAQALRSQRLRQQLAAAPSITDALYDAGYSSSGRFYEEADQVLGMTPGQWRRGGEGMTIRFAVGQCALGAVLVAESQRGVCAILLGDEPEPLLHELQRHFHAATMLGGDAGFDLRVAQVAAFVEQPVRGLDLPLDIRGTVFQQKVWQALRQIPAGSRLSYAELAQRIGAPSAVRAVAGACAANVLAVAIPCHRVVRSDGGLSGYRWGIERKQALLQREAEF